MTTLAAPPPAEGLETKVAGIVREAQAITVTDAQSAEFAGDFLRTVKTAQKTVKDECDPMVDAAHKAHKLAVAHRTKLLDPLTRAEDVIKGRLKDYMAAEERKRRELEDRLRREQEEKAAAEAEALRRAEEDRRLNEAAALEASGHKEEAAALIEAPVVIETPIAAPIVVAPTAPKIAGVSGRTSWSFEVTDESAIPREYLSVDLKKIGGVVRAMKGMTKIPGVRVFAETGISAKSW